MDERKSTKQIVLEILKNGGFVSGEELAQKTKVSRTAIWKAVESLRKDGWAIEAVTNKGYLLSPEKSALSKQNLLEHLKEFSNGNDIQIDFFPSIDSTNNELKRLASSVPSIRDSKGNLTEEGKKLHKRAIIASEQTAGRGRLGRSFFSANGAGIFMSLFYSPKAGVTDPARMTANAAVAVCRAISALFGLEAQIKWVNDIFLDGKKICGILAEGVSNLETGIIEGAVIGIGINICAPDSLPAELRDIVGFLEDAAELKGKSADKNKLAVTVLSELVRIYDTDDDGNTAEKQKCLEEYRSRSILTGKTIQVTPVIGEERTTFQAKVMGIGDALSLIVEDNEGKRLSLKSGEVSLSSSKIARK